ncbi:MAG: sensor domain-containing diguanylate cyclase [Actinomycetia bacterium]|nr:sensor domain-containing diguanylate cyclase [Actinomycetes bacterium]
MTGAVTGAMPGADERLAGLVRLARALAHAGSLADVVERAAEEARFAFGARSVSVSELERERGLVRVLVNAGELAPGEDRHPSDEVYRLADFPLLVRMVDEARPWTVRVDDPEADPAERALLEGLGAASALAAPILAEGRIWGELFATRSAEAPRFDDGDLAFAQAFAGLVSAGIAQVEHLALVQRLAYQDPLTGLGNRRLVEERLEVALAGQRAGGPPVSVVMADVNRLKQANDRFGHEAGDRALVAVATALSVATGKVPGAVAGRLGGDEFCAVLPGHGLEVASALAAAFLRGAADAPYGVGVACGVASTEQLTTVPTVARMFALADEAQYRAKRTGTDLPVVADPDLGGRDRRALRGRAEESLLSAALACLTAGPGGPGQPTADRLVVLAETLADALEASGWVVSRVRSGAAVPVRHSARRPGVLVTVSVPASGAWLGAALGVGLVVDVDDEAVPLAGVRGCSHVVVAASGGWVVELLLDGREPRPDAAPVLRAGVAVAAGG